MVSEVRNREPAAAAATERVRPRALRAGARVLLVSPAGPSPERRIAAAVERCRTLGLEPVVAGSAAARHGYLAGHDDARGADLRRGLEDPDIDAVWAIRGGYGATRILDRIDAAATRRHPKPFIGFSDNTAVHLVLARAGVISYHGPHAGGAFPQFTDTCLRRVLFDATPAGELPLPPGSMPTTLRAGVAEGPLVGGNLSLLTACCGTRAQLDARGRVLFLEDVGEAVYRIDRMLTQLTASGAVDGIAGVAFGAFTGIPEQKEDLPLLEVLGEWVERLGVPAVAGLPIGHVDEIWTLPLGVRARLDAARGTLSLLEPAVT